MQSIDIIRLHLQNGNYNIDNTLSLDTSNNVLLEQLANKIM